MARLAERFKQLMGEAIPTALWTTAATLPAWFLGSDYLEQACAGRTVLGVTVAAFWIWTFLCLVMMQEARRSP